MRLFVFCQVLLLALCLCAPLVAQHSLSPGPFAKVPVLTLPQQDNDALRQAEMAKRRPGRPATFAVSLPVQVRPEKAGQWTRQGTTSIWYLRIQSPGAKTLNLGFSEFHLPTGAEFYISSATERFGPFTAADNEVHNQLWTPVIVGDELLLELRTPEHLRKGVQLYLTSVNHDFVDITKSASGSCNLDVICGENDGWGIVEPYRDIIRSVAAYTINGVSTCTGFLVNNANEDGRPLFMTANHCTVTPVRAPSMMVYWNYENSFCRQPGSAASGGNGNGQRNIFNSGATHLASFFDSDVTLTELDDPVNPNANAFFAGWSNEMALPTDTLITIHHPGVEEKRISFSFQSVRRVSFNDIPEGLEVPFWDIGTTEGGSSGAPIFDKNKRVRGQLFGGLADCTNQLYDIYGYFAVSWEGGGSSGTRLRDWLDPCGLGMTSMDGLNQSDLNTIVTTDNNCLTACANAKLDVPITLGSGFPAGSPVVVSSAPDIFGTSLSSSTAGGGQTVTLTISGDADTPNGVYSVTVSVGSGSTQDDITLIVEFTGETLAAPTLSTPANGSTGVSPNVVLSWNPVGNARSYDVQLAADENFDTILESRSNIPTTSAGFTDPLPGNTTFYWRIRGVSECGAGEWSSPFFFTTADISCAGAASTDVPVTISSDGTPTVRANLNVASSLVIESMEVILNVSHTFIGDLSATLTSPDGTTINLFNQISEGGCIGDNLSVIFSDEAAQTSADFENACSENIPSVAGTFQSAEALSIFNGENAVGNWILTVTDNFDFDGGAITDFEILFCETRPLSLQSFGANRSLNVYPNPVRGLLNLEASGNWTSDIDAMLLDATGRQLRTFRIANPAGTLTQIDLSGLSAGVYYLRLVNQGIERTERLVVMP